MTEQATAKQPKGATPNTPPQQRPRWQVWSIRLLAGWLTLCLLLWLGGPPLLKRVLPWAVAQKLPVQPEQVPVPLVLLVRPAAQPVRRLHRVQATRAVHRTRTTRLATSPN